jgi:LPXTG-site transpeptidase (sortase) family protein
LKVINPLTAANTPLAPNGQKLSDFLNERIENDHLLVPSINVNAPVTWSSSPDKILDDLRNGVAHYAGTALPGQNGNVFISGHSSNFWWDPGKFKQVFVLLDKVNEGDRIYVKYKGQSFIYVVESKKVVKPSQIEVLNPSDHSIITLMTCTPVGTTLNRLVVQAKQIYPTTTNQPIQTQVIPQELPAIR